MNAWFIRQISLPLWYRFKGFHVQEKLQLFRNNQWKSRDEIESEQFQKLQKLIAFCHNHVPFYQSLFHEMQFEPGDLKDLSQLSQLPVLSKNSLIKRMEELRPRNTDIASISRQTNGSTAEPHVNFIDYNALSNQLAAKLFSREWWEWQNGEKYVSILGRLNPEQSLRRTLLDSLVHNHRLISTFNLTRETVDDIYHLLRQFKPALLYGWCYALHTLAKLFLEYGYDTSIFNLKAVFSSSEILHEHMRDRMQAVYHCPVVNEYGCAETGSIGFECPRGNMHIMSDYLIVEARPRVIDGRDSDLNDLLVTDLENYAMPLIRYQLGDVGNLKPGVCDCGRGSHLMHIDIGRDQDIVYLENHKTVHPAIFSFMVKAAYQRLGKGIDCYQTIQRSKTAFDMYLVVSNGLEQQVTSFFTEQFKQHLGENVTVQFHFVDHIPASQSGKFREVISRRHENG